ncbi:pleiotropic drug resistance 2 [Striga asiatica]|uniref:Pleiotropic drug resistance 2 n=1 Tax=Striga asiatica TaxID=4170 RepID=A0A5A7QQA8_STRAF|nr:pleiotropic drug resistance 2 [Striga asiatica]
MDAFDTDHNAIMRANNTNAFPKIKKLLRTLEILVILVYLTSAIVRLPSAVKFAGEYFRRLALFVNNIQGERSTPLTRTSQRSEKIVLQDKETISEVKTKLACEVCRPEEDKGCNNCGGRRRRVAAADGGRQVEGLSNEEFKRAIEGFIARQINFHRQEQLAIVVHSRVGNCYNYK